MIGVINPNETETLAVQLEYAKNATTQMTPGEAMPSETAKATSTSTSTPGSSADSDDHNHHLSAGAIAGIAIGGAVVLLLAGVLIYLCGRRGGFDKAYYRQSRHGHGAEPPTMVEANYHHPGSGPKSPGQETFATTAYSTTPSNDPYQPPQPGHGAAHTGYPVGSSASPPPRSVHSQGSYQLYGGAPGVGSPLMQGIDGGKVQNGYLNAPNATGTPDFYQQQPRQELSPQTVAPVELPTSGDPGNSPLPSYTNGPRTFSWSTGGEGMYRPGKPT
ncbi:hypothetical protein SLS53_009293 [Cytospora paraplurivora]|uniref:Transmembrane protein n=1 Tax=Cytospora paraplurivora TaxID=2898453 RepID=A0AAN9TWX6_9PEZI